MGQSAIKAVGKTPVKTAMTSSTPRIQRIIRRNDVYKHYKGNMYKVLGVAKDTETGIFGVVYHDVNESPDDKLWHRPVDMFNDYVVIEDDLDKNKKENKLRFEQVIYI